VSGVTFLRSSGFGDRQLLRVFGGRCPQLLRSDTAGADVWLRSLGGGVFAALRGGLVAAITQDWLQVGVAV
jgi:hypothetical protein